jgi:tetratricopeptide (TPR) repeat protein
MKMQMHLWFWVCGIIAIPLLSPAQETPDIDIEQSAEVFLEAYSDDFQENFFEALKQKGIENYDKAINLFLECKRLDASNRVVDHELAKVYLQEKQYPTAEEYALTAVNAEPKNLWYAHTLVDILQKQGKSIDNIKEDLPFEDTKLKENLAFIYFKKERYETALSLIQETQKSSFTTDLGLKISDSIEKRQAKVAGPPLVMENITGSAEDSFEQYKVRIEDFLRTDNYVMLNEVAEEALENYPSQPYFYYALGYALNRKAKPEEAIESLEAGLDYLVDDVSLANKLFQELSDAYNSINNSVKANMYLRKIKPGF